MAAPGSGDGSNELRLKPRDSPIIVGRFTSCLSLPSLRLHPSGAGDDRDGCWRLLMLLDCSSTVEWGTTHICCTRNFIDLYPIPMGWLHSITTVHRFYGRNPALGLARFRTSKHSNSCGRLVIFSKAEGTARGCHTGA